MLFEAQYLCTEKMTQTVLLTVATNEQFSCIWTVYSILHVKLKTTTAYLPCDLLFTRNP